MNAFTVNRCQPCEECDAPAKKKIGVLWLCAAHASTIYDGLTPRIVDLPPPAPPKPPRPPRQPHWAPTAKVAKVATPRPIKAIVVEGYEPCRSPGCPSSGVVRGLCRRCHRDKEKRDNLALPSKQGNYSKTPWSMTQETIDLSRLGCVVIGCDRDRYVRGLCVTHYDNVLSKKALKRLTLPKAPLGPKKVAKSPLVAVLVE